MQVVSKKSIVKLSSFYEALVFFVEGEERIERNEHAQNVNENEGIWAGVTYLYERWGQTWRKEARSLVGQ
jgi:hypothetical protein